MNKLLARLFIKDYENIEDSRVRNSYGTLSSIFGIIMNAIVSLSKIIIGAITASISIIADGINNLSDMASSGISLVGFKISNRPADKEHPFGHARMEYISALIIAFLIIFVGIQLAISSVENIISKATPSFSIIALVILSVSIVIKALMAIFYLNYAKLIKSSTLKACALDSFNDCVATALVLIALIISRFTNIVLDGYVGAIVSVYIVISGIKIVIETLSPLLGEKPAPELVKTIVEKTRAYNGILGIHDLVFHNYGANKYFITFHAEVDSSVDVMISHELIDTIENELSTDNIHVVIHLDPIVVNDPKTNALKQMVLGIIGEISPNLNIHDFRAIIGPNRTNLIFDLLLPDHTSYDKDTITKIISERITEIDPSCKAIISVDYPFIDVT